MKAKTEKLGSEESWRPAPPPAVFRGRGERLAAAAVWACLAAVWAVLLPAGLRFLQADAAYQGGWARRCESFDAAVRRERVAVGLCGAVLLSATWIWWRSARTRRGRLFRPGRSCGTAGPLAPLLAAAVLAGAAEVAAAGPIRSSGLPARYWTQAALVALAAAGALLAMARAVGVMFYDGGVLFDSEGKIVFGDDDCDCCPSGCEYCPDSTPAAYDVTFTGVSMRTTCIDDAFGMESGKVTAGALDGTYRLTKDPSNPCIWRGTADIDASIWDSTGCTGSPTATTSCAITLTRTQELGTNGWYLLVEGTGGVTVQYFQNFTMAASTNCASGLPTINNGITVHGVTGGTYWLGKDGSASLAVV